MAPTDDDQADLEETAAPVGRAAHDPYAPRPRRLAEVHQLELVPLPDEMATRLYTAGATAEEVQALEEHWQEGNEDQRQHVTDAFAELTDDEAAEFVEGWRTALEHGDDGEDAEVVFSWDLGQNGTAPGGCLVCQELAEEEFSDEELATIPEHDPAAHLAAPSAEGLGLVLSQPLEEPVQDAEGLPPFGSPEWWTAVLPEGTTIVFGTPEPFDQQAGEEIAAGDQLEQTGPDLPEVVPEGMVRASFTVEDEDGKGYGMTADVPEDADAVLAMLTASEGLEGADQKDRARLVLAAELDRSPSRQRKSVIAAVTETLGEAEVAERVAALEG